MKYTRKRIELELSDRQLTYLQGIADSCGDTLSEVMKDFFYIYLQNRMNDNEIVVIPIK